MSDHIYYDMLAGNRAETVRVKRSEQDHPTQLPTETGAGRGAGWGRWACLAAGAALLCLAGTGAGILACGGDSPPAFCSLATSILRAEKCPQDWFRLGGHCYAALRESCGPGCSREAAQLVCADQKVRITKLSPQSCESPTHLD